MLVYKFWVKECLKFFYYVVWFLDGFWVFYVVSEVDDRLFLDLKEDLKLDIIVGWYLFVIFVDIKVYFEFKFNV